MNSSGTTFLMLSAMYENGGNTTHRLLDGHPELFVYPFESQPGTKFVNDHLSGLYPLKYRWPIFPNSASPEQIYHMIIDEECKIRANTPFVSKFRDADFDFTSADRLAAFVKELSGKPLTRPNIMAAFFAATFTAWKNFNRSGKETCVVGYSPIIGVDGEKIIMDFNGNGSVLHVIRNPFSAYADTKKRPVPLSIEHYMMGWNTCQYYAKLLEAKYPSNFFTVRFEDIVASPAQTLGAIVQRMGFQPSETLGTISWNGKKLEQVYPWGTIRMPTPEANIKTAQELSKPEIEEIYVRTRRWIEDLGYAEISAQLRSA